MAWMKVSILLCILPSLEGFFFIKETSGDLKPSSPEVCTMEDLTLTYFPKNTSDLENATLNIIGKDGYRGDGNATREVNTTGGYVAFIVRNITQNLHNAVISSCSGICDKTSNSILLKVYETPQPVKNFSCKVFNYFDGMNCSWERGADYKWVTEHVLKWRIPTYQSNWNNCSNPADTYCYWRGTEDGDYSMKKIDILLTLEKSQCRQNMSMNFSINAGMIVEPAPVVDLGGTAINSTCINFTWTTTLHSHLKINRIIYDSQWNKSQTILLEDLVDEAFKKLTVCDLHPATNYTFVVTVIPKQGGYWSQPRAISLTTHDDLPSASPQILPWTFSQSPQYCDFILTPVTIHWLPLPEFHQNGPLKAYTVIAMRVNNTGMLTKESVNEAPGDRNQITLYLNCTNTYIISVHPRNSKGYSPMNSTVTIPAISHVPPQPEFIVERANRTSQKGLTQVTMTLMYVGQNSNAVNYTVLWCTKGELGSCVDASLNWLTFQAYNSKLELDVPDPESLLMGISVETQNGSSVVTWSSCIYAMHAEPSREPRNVDVREGSGDRTLLVTWDKIPCEPGQPYIHQYHIIYCKTGQAGICEESSKVTVGSESSRVELRELMADRTYKIAVQGVTRTGLVGPLSQYITGEPVDNSIQPGGIAGIAVGCLFLFLLGICGLVHIIRVIKRKKKEILERPDIQDISTFPGAQLDSPHITSEASNPYCTLFDRQFSNDSGFPSSPTTNQSFRQTISKRDYVDALQENIPNSSKDSAHSETLAKEPLRKLSDDSLFGKDSFTSEKPEDTQQPGGDVSGYVTAEIETTTNSPDDDTEIKTPIKADNDSLFGGDSYISEESHEPCRDVGGYVKAKHVSNAVDQKLERTIASGTSHESDQSNQAAEYQQAFALTESGEKKQEIALEEVKLRETGVSELNSEDALNEVQRKNGELNDSKRNASEKKARSSNGSQNSRNSTESLGYAKAVQMDSCKRSSNGHHNTLELSKSHNCEEFIQVHFVNQQTDVGSLKEEIGHRNLDGKVAVLGSDNAVSATATINTPASSSFEFGQSEQANMGFVFSTELSHNNKQQSLPNTGYVPSTDLSQNKSQGPSNTGYVLSMDLSQNKPQSPPNTEYVLSKDLSQNQPKGTPNIGYVLSTDLSQNKPQSPPNTEYVLSTDLSQNKPQCTPTIGYVLSTDLSQNKTQSPSKTGYVPSTDLSQNQPQGTPNIGYVLSTDLSQNKPQSPPKTGYFLSTDLSQNKPQSPPNIGYVLSTDLSQNKPQSPTTTGYVPSIDVIQKIPPKTSIYGFVPNGVLLQNKVHNPPNIYSVASPECSQNKAPNPLTNGYVVSTDLFQNIAQNPNYSDKVHNRQSLEGGSSKTVEQTEHVICQNQDSLTLIANNDTLCNPSYSMSTGLENTGYVTDHAS